MIAIPDMSKPKNCAECFRILKCKAVPRWVTADDSIPKSCPLIDIVRCEECKYWDESIKGHIYVGDHLCRRRLRWTMEIDFCSDGERRTDE